MAGARVLFAASEVAGFAKTGGLADVAAALPRALAEPRQHVAVVMPLYNAVRRAGLADRANTDRPAGPDGRPRPRLPPLPLAACPTPTCRSTWSSTSRSSSATTRPGPRPLPADDGGRYKADYPDNAERFVFFSRAVLEPSRTSASRPDVIHANDWQTGLVPVFLRRRTGRSAGYQRIRSVFTIHNIAYQGMFGRDVMNLTGLPGWLFNHHKLEFYGQFNFLKAGIVFADAVNTVSPTYAREIQTAEFGCGLEGLLAGVHGSSSGIVNGFDYEHWDPANDRHIAAPYSRATVFEKKPLCKADLQRRFHLPKTRPRRCSAWSPGS